MLSTFNLYVPTSMHRACLDCIKFFGLIIVWCILDTAILTWIHGYPYLENTRSRSLFLPASGKKQCRANMWTCKNFFHKNSSPQETTDLISP